MSMDHIAWLKYWSEMWYLELLDDKDSIVNSKKKSRKVNENDKKSQTFI